MNTLKQLSHYRITIAITVLAVIAHWFPSLNVVLQLDFTAVQNGQWWRVGTGHLTHYGNSHLGWDMLMFVVLGVVCERRHHRWFAAAIAVMMTGISWAIYLCCDSITVYRGLSGLDSGLFLWFLTDQILDAVKQADRRAVALWSAPAIAFIGKSSFEAFTGQTMFVDSANFQPLVESHLAGAALGFVCALPSAIAMPTTSGSNQHGQPTRTCLPQRLNIRRIH